MVVHGRVRVYLVVRGREVRGHDVSVHIVVHGRNIWGHGVPCTSMGATSPCASLIIFYSNPGVILEGESPSLRL